MGTSGLEQLLGVLEEEFSDFEQAQASDSDDGQVSGTEQGSYPDAPSATLYVTPHSLPQPKVPSLRNLVGCIHSILAGESMLHLLLTDFIAHSPYKQYCTVLC